MAKRDEPTVEGEELLDLAARCATLAELHRYRPAALIAALVERWRDRPPAELLAALAALPPLPPEDDPAWDSPRHWMDVVWPYVAFGDLAALHELRPAVALLLDRACDGDPGEIMRGLRHSLEHIAGGDWTWLADECIAAIERGRPGTVLWAADQLAILDDPRARPVFERLLGSPHERIRDAADLGLARLS